MEYTLDVQSRFAEICKNRGKLYTFGMVTAKRTPRNPTALKEHEALSHFKKVDPKLYKAGVPHRESIATRIVFKSTNASLFNALAGTIIGQQLSTKAASTIRGRVTAVCGVSGITAKAIEEVSIQDLQGAGLSAAKAKTLKELSYAVLHQDLNLQKLRTLSPEEATEKLLAVWGVGPWTVQMFFMFSLGMPDIFSAGDLGLARGMELLYGLPKNTAREELEKISKRWAPYRTYASLILWAHYDCRNR